jgi:hypothetical protein
MGLICRQQAVFHPEASWNWLSEAERWEDLAEAAIATTRPSIERFPVILAQGKTLDSKYDAGRRQPEAGSVSAPSQARRCATSDTRLWMRLLRSMRST